MKRTLTKELPEKKGEKVKLKGWVHRLRELGELCFLILRERTGQCQILLTKGQAKELRPECVVEIVGTVREERRAKQGVEVQAELVKILCPAEALPIELHSEKKLTIPAIMKHRPISLRRRKQQAIFKVQAELIHSFREFMKSQGFTEIHSTKLTAGGLEGGSEMFEVEYFGKKAYLAQSPQFYKQMMVGVFERVFEVGKVYRAEPSATTRHLAEYIGLDFEMGFIESVKEVMEMEEKMLKHVMKYVRKTCKKELALFGAEVPEIISIPRIPFIEAIQMLEKEHGKKFSREDLSPEAERLLCELVKQKYSSEFVFVTKYPAGKRPFYTMPSEKFTESFDLLFRGVEITTGGQRIHKYKQLVKAMKAKGISPESYESYLMCFKHGMPPHGGVGIGAERVVQKLLGLQSAEEASLIPRTKERFLH